jgi:hypothetical protein
MGIIINDDSQPVSVHTYTLDVTKANPYHDAASGRFTTGGGGGGGGGAKPSTGTSSNQAVADAQEDLSNRAKGAEDASRRIKIDGAKNLRNLQASKTKDRLEGAADGFDVAAGVVGDPTEMKRLAAKYPKPTYDSNLDAYKTGFHDAIQASVSDYGSLSDAVTKANPYKDGATGRFTTGGGGGGKTQIVQHQDTARTSLDEATKLGADANGTSKIKQAIDKKDSSGLREMRTSIVRDRQRLLNSGRPEARSMRKKEINMLAHLANGVNSGLASFEGKAPYRDVPLI